MNTQEYIKPEIVVPALILLGSALFVYGMIRYMISSLKGSPQTKAEDLCENCSEEEKINIKVGHTYYKKKLCELSPVPWPQPEESIKILAIRGAWVKYINLDGEEKEELYADKVWIDDYFMEDEFGDFVKPKFERLIEKSKPKIGDLDASVGFVPEGFIPKEDVEDVPEMPSTKMNNVIQIDGKDYTLTPVKK